MKEFGWTMPMLIAESGTIIAGHGRLLAAIKLGMTNAPVIVARDWNEARQRAYTIADNQLALNSNWDQLRLGQEFEALKLESFDVTLLGFNDAELSRFSGGNEAFDSAEKEWQQGMPEFEQPDKMPFRSIIVHFRDDAAVEEFARLIGQALTAKTKYVWSPAAERTVNVDKYYASNES